MNLGENDFFLFPRTGRKLYPNERMQLPESGRMHVLFAAGNSISHVGIIAKELACDPNVNRVLHYVSS